MKPDFFRILISPWMGVGLVIVASFPFWLPSYHLHIAILTLIYVALAYAWNIVGGLAGQISLAHSLFVGTGALFAAALNLNLGINLWAAGLIAAAVAAVFGVAIAWIEFRFKLTHLSFALITLACAEVGELVVLGSDFLGGASGLSLPRDKGDLSQFMFGGSNGYFWLMLVLAFLCFVINLAVMNAPLGYFLRAIRDNENAAQAVGVRLLRNKAIAMALSAALSSLIGTAYARYLTFADPYLLASPVLVIEIVLFTTVGGLGTIFGPLIGSGVLVPVGELLRGSLGGVLPGLHQFIYGVAVVVVILALPRGLTPAFRVLWRRWQQG